MIIKKKESSMKNFSKMLITLVSLIFVLSCGEDSNPTDNTKNPSITTISPNKVLSADKITINGTNFGADRGESKVYFNDIPATIYFSWSDTKIELEVPIINVGGKLKVVVNNVSSNLVDYSLDDNPRIKSVGNGRAYVEQDVDIKGINFGASKGSVSFNGVDAPTISKWTDTLITVNVPKSALTGNVVVTTAGGKKSNGFYFTIATNEDPFINMISPVFVAIGDEIRIVGKNFGDIQGANYVDFNGVKATKYNSWSKSEIKVVVPAKATSGPVRVFIGTQGSNTVNITVNIAMPDPIINSLSKTEFEIGDVITINGQNFGKMETDSSYVYFNTLKANEILSWENTMIKVTVPKNATSGQLKVTIGKQSSNAVSYTIKQTVKEPKITSLVPSIAQSGQEVDIIGENFGATKGSDAYIMFGTTKITNMKSWSDTKVTFTVPEMDAGIVDVYIFNNNLKSNSVKFTIQQKAIVIVPMVEIPKGTFMMGSSDEKDGDAFPQMKVTISKNFYVSETEITQTQYKKVMNQKNPSKVVGDDYPVEQVTWLDAVDFCNRLSKLEGFTEAYTINGTNVTLNKFANGYRLLTEAEWEYAARAGSTGKYGNVGGTEAAANEIGWTNSNTTKLQKVKLLKANDFGLYDMHGNVAEWCWDLYDFYEEGEYTDPTGPTDGVERVFRGGGYIDGPPLCTVFKRYAASTQMFQFYIGFRVARNK